MKGSSQQRRFPGEDAIAAIPQYERRRLARSVYFGFSDAPDNVPKPYPKGADCYDAVPAIEEQLADKAKTAEMLEALTAYLDGMDEGNRHYDSCQRAREQLSEYVNGTFSLFNHRHDHTLRQAEQRAIPTTPAEEVEVTEESVQVQKPSLSQEHQQKAQKEPTQAAMPPAFTLPRKKERMEAGRPAVRGRRQLPYHRRCPGRSAAQSAVCQQRSGNTAFEAGGGGESPRHSRGAGGLVPVCGLGRSGGLL